jgi:hypothetical protein
MEEFAALRSIMLEQNTNQATRENVSLSMFPMQRCRRATVHCSSVEVLGFDYFDRGGLTDTSDRIRQGSGLAGPESVHHQLSALFASSAPLTMTGTAFFIDCYSCTIGTVSSATVLFITMNQVSATTRRVVHKVAHRVTIDW